MMELHYLFYLCIFSIFIHCTRGVNLGEEEYKVLTEIVEEFKNNPTDPKYDHVINVPINKAHLIPKIFIWCPMLHFKISLRCPECNNELRVSSFAQAGSGTKGGKDRAPRLVYDIGGNILLVQSYYICMKNREKQHSFMSGTPEIMNKLPGNIAKKLPLILHYKSGFSNDLLDFLLISLGQGHTCQEIIEMIASLNYRKFVERNHLAGITDAAKSFHDNIIYSFTSGDKLMHLFLWDFEQKSELYKRHINSLSCSTLVIDTTYKMEKKCKMKGASNEDSKDMQLDNVLIGLNENGEVVLWKPVKSKAFEDIKDALEEFKHLLESKGQELNAILTSDCCVNRGLYQHLFPTVPVKMGVVHAIKSVTKTLPKDHPDTMVFAHKLLQIFSSSSTEDQRTEETTSPLEIEANLDLLLMNWRTKLTENTLLSLDYLRHHIRRGCLSGIPSGEGTEKIDPLHRYLQKSFLGRVTVITPEMAFAVFTCLIYAWNCKKQYKKGRRATPLTPIEAHTDLKPTTSEVDQSKVDIKGLTDSKGVEPLVINCTQQSDNGAVTSMLVITADVVEYMFLRLLHIQDLISAFKDRCQKSFGMSDFPVFTSSSGISPYVKLTPQTSEHDLNVGILTKNLADYGLQIEKVAGDGNCLFRSIAIQAKKLSESTPDLKALLEAIGMGKTQEEDTAKLRDLFVTELKTNFATYKNWIDVSNTNFEQELESFKREGFFASDIGDLCIKVCSNVLQLPIIVVPSLENVKFFPFLPTKFTTAHPIYIAYNHTAPGHYDATKELQVPPPTNKCRCGKVSKSKKENDKMFCDPSDGKCPCVVDKLPCVYCQCHNCLNKPPPGTPLSCKCNASRKRGVKDTCLNKERASCCCARAGLPCTMNCFCYNCCNGKPEDKQEEKSEGETPRKRARKGFKNKQTPAMKENDDPSRPQEWTEQELICLMVCREVLAACNIEQNVHNIGQVFSYIAKSKNNPNLGLSISEKTDQEIQDKLQFLHFGIPVVTQLVALNAATSTS